MAQRCADPPTQTAAPSKTGEGLPYLEGNVILSETLENDGEDQKLIPGDVDTNEYTLTLRCDDLEDSVDFTVS